mmetsp:Transcript_3686/g.23138  ORF Transcript_3686/g.23138 Transcript_3686/m.23138 type:complete len:124 (+) Transcript_3686:1629-2000(+)
MMKQDEDVSHQTHQKEADSLLGGVVDVEYVFQFEAPAIEECISIARHCSLVAYSCKYCDVDEDHGRSKDVLEFHLTIGAVCPYSRCLMLLQRRSCWSSFKQRHETSSTFQVQTTAEDDPADST